MLIGASGAMVKETKKISFKMKTTLFMFLKS